MREHEPKSESRHMHSRANAVLVRIAKNQRGSSVTPSVPTINNKLERDKEENSSSSFQFNESFQGSKNGVGQSRNSKVTNEVMKSIPKANREMNSSMFSS